MKFDLKEIMLFIQGLEVVDVCFFIFVTAPAIFLFVSGIAITWEKFEDLEDKLRDKKREWERVKNENKAREEEKTLSEEAKWQRKMEGERKARKKWLRDKEYEIQGRYYIERQKEKQKNKDEKK